jgi:hypothetical protein
MVREPVRVCDGGEEWIFDGDLGLSSKQIGQLLSRTRPTAGYERNLDYVTAQCFEIYAKHVGIWRVPGTTTVFSVAARRYNASS